MQREIKVQFSQVPEGGLFFTPRKDEKKTYHGWIKLDECCGGAAAKETPILEYFGPGDAVFVNRGLWKEWQEDGVV